ncbi:tetratricopeptide repeat protein [Ornithinibacillus contaminans]|uniref:tetratricopeptide repeat protein n=1 Tax=Ornithinibacillus contaminans TaxID=694055 RepID=UPI00064DDC32|nr:tetratricopeptide repeat protein [Ornithinibacillus contaminans]
MRDGNENVVLFPKWEMSLKDESLKALQDKRYEEALEKLEALLHYNVSNHEIIIGKLMCLMELGRYQEAEDTCAEIIRNKEDVHYYHYLHMYLTILFQTNKYRLLMELIEEELESDELPLVLREQFHQLYDMSEKMDFDIAEEKSSKYTDDLMDAVAEANHNKQWQLLVQLRTMKKEPDKQAISLLKKHDVHPVIKTAIFLWLQETNYSNLVDVHKLGKQLHINPAEIVEIKKHPTYLTILQYLSGLEQENPTLYQFLEQLLYRYFYIHYPILPPDIDAALIAEGLQQLSNQLFIQSEEEQPSINNEVESYLEDILNAEQLYLSIIDE